VATDPEKPKQRTNPLLDDDDIIPVSEPAAHPRVMPKFVEKYIQTAEEKRVTEAEELPQQPRWPMIEGILTFPFYLNTIASWMFISGGLIITSWLLMFWYEYGMTMGPSSSWYLGLPTCTALVLTLGYAASCCFTIMEETAGGWDTFEVAPDIQWKEWVWNFAHITALALQAAVVGYVLQIICSFLLSAMPGSFSDSLGKDIVDVISGSRSWLFCTWAALMVFPLILLGALAADGAWAPAAIGTVLLSLVQVWWAWALFYVETIPMMVAWTMITINELVGYTPKLVPVYSAPLLAAIILIYARLIGRLAGCIDEKTAQLLEEGEYEDE
jgi:hypothetical protein